MGDVLDSFPVSATSGTLPVRSRRDDLPLTALGLGVAQLGNLYRAMSDEDAARIVAAAWDRGIRYFDTAPHYGVGLSERRLGSILSGYPRDAVVISTKVGRLLTPSPSTAHLRDDQGFDVPRDPVRRWDFSRDGILRSVEDSLGRLGLDRIDVLYLHDPDEWFEQASTEGVGALVELRDQGVVRGIGAGMNSAAPLAELIRRADVDLVMVAGRTTLLDRSAEEELLPLAQERGVGVVAAGVYNSGILAMSRPDASATYDYGAAPAEILSRVTSIAQTCERFGVELPVAAVAYASRHPAVVSVVLGASRVSQVESNVVRFLAAARIPEALWTALAQEGLLPPSPTLHEGRP